MAVVAGVLSETRRRTLEAMCDTIVPSIELDSEDAAVTEFYARAASDLGVAAQIEGVLAQAMMPEEMEGVGRLIDARDNAALWLPRQRANAQYDDVEVGFTDAGLRRWRK